MLLLLKLKLNYSLICNLNVNRRKFSFTRNGVDYEKDLCVFVKTAILYDDTLNHNVFN